MSSNSQPPAPGSDPRRADDAREPLLDWATQAGAVDDVLRVMETRLRQRRARRLRAAFAGVAVFAVGFFAWQMVARRNDAAARPPIPAGALVVSAPSRQQLPDGSLVELKDGAKIAVEFSERLRRVVLQRGEAHFAVAKDPSKPFVVIARGLAVSAVGTAFSVNTADEKLEVVVTEGRVAVDQPLNAAEVAAATTTTASATLTPAAAGSASPSLAASAATTAPASGPSHLPAARPLALLDAGKRLVVDAAPAAESTSAAPVTPSVQTLSDTELRARLAWRVPRLEFSGTPLREIVPAINRHSRVQVVLADAELQDIRLSGTLRADDIETLLGLLEDGYRVRIERRSSGEVALHKGR